MIYFNPLHIGEFCCEQTLTENEQLIVDYWNQVNDCVMTNIDAAYKKELFGRDSECSFNAVNNFHYLLSLLLHIKEQVDLDSTLTVSDIYELYDLDCIKKTFMCCGCNITNALKVFGLAKENDDVPEIPNNTYPETPEDDPYDINEGNADEEICSGSEFSYTPIPIIQGSYVTWSRAAVAGISNPAASGNTTITETLVNTTASTVSVTYVITITNGSLTWTENLVVDVKPAPTLTSSLNMIHIAAGGETVTYTPTSNITGATFEWYRPDSECVKGPASSGTGNISEFITASARCTFTYYIRVCYGDCCSGYYELNVTTVEMPD